MAPLELRQALFLVPSSHPPGLAGVWASVAFWWLLLHFVSWPLLCNTRQSFTSRCGFWWLEGVPTLSDMLAHFLPGQILASSLCRVTCAVDSAPCPCGLRCQLLAILSEQ